MTIKECYEEMGADYEDVRRRFLSDERITRFIGSFERDETFQNLKCAMQENDGNEAFRAAHSLKGICMNLSLTKLQASAAALTEALRGGGVDSRAGRLYEQTEADYQDTIRCIGSCLHE